VTGATELAAPQVLQEHSAKPGAVQGAVSSSRRWQHAFGEMLIETCDDGSVWIDGKPVPETLELNRGTP
jgi:hypothetical protein